MCDNLLRDLLPKAIQATAEWDDEFDVEWDELDEDEDDEWDDFDADEDDDWGDAFDNDNDDLE